MGFIVMAQGAEHPRFNSNVTPVFSILLSFRYIFISLLLFQTIANIRSIISCPRIKEKKGNVQSLFRSDKLATERQYPPLHIYEWSIVETSSPIDSDYDLYD